MRSEIWGVLTSALGINLWYMLCVVPIQIEWTSADTRWTALGLYALPLILLASGTLTRRSVLLVLGFLVSLIPAYLVLPVIDRDMLREGPTFFPFAASVVAYAAVASLWCGSRAPRVVDGTGIPARDGRRLTASLHDPLPRAVDLWWPYRVHFLPRWVLLVALLLVPIYGLNFADGVAERYVASFARDADQAQVMANLLALFGWVIVGYLFFVSPGLNLELEQRELDRALARYESGILARPPVRFVVAGSILAVLLMVGLAIAIAMR